VDNWCYVLATYAGMFLLCIKNALLLLNTVLP
jgi:hypothetical protein